MSKTRKQIENKIKSNIEKIKALDAANLELRKEAILMSDSKQQFTEKTETHTISRRPKIEKEFLIGRRHWKEDFVDEDTGHVITIERSQIVRVDGEWKNWIN